MFFTLLQSNDSQNNSAIQWQIKLTCANPGDFSAGPTLGIADVEYEKIKNLR